MANTTTAVLESLKYGYGVNRVLYLFNQESVVFNILSHQKKRVGGRGQFLMPVMVQNPGAFTGISEGGPLPTALDADTAEASFILHEFVAVYTLTWKLIQDSSSDKFAFQQAVTMLDDGLKYRVMRNLNADLIDNGKGRLAVLTGVDAPGAIITSAFLPRCEVGQVVDVMDLTDDDTKLGDSRTVTAVDPIARTVDLSGVDLTGEAAGDYLVIQDTCDIGATAALGNPSLHANGLLSVINDTNPSSAVVTNYGGVTRALVSGVRNDWWRAVILGNSAVNRPLTEDLMLQAMDGVREKGGGAITHWISNLAIVRRYHEMLAGERYFSLSQPGAIGGGIGRKSMDPTSKEGKTPYEFSGVPWHVDPYFGNNTIVGLNSDHFFIGTGENEVPRPISEIFDNVPFFKQTSSATFDVNWYYQMELLSDNPVAGCQIQDVAES